MIELVETLMMILILNLGNPSWRIRHDIHMDIAKDKNPAWVRLLHNERRSKDLEIRFRIRRLLKKKVSELPLVWFAEKQNKKFFYMKENQVMSLFKKQEEIPEWFKKSHFGPLNIKDKELGVKLLAKALRVKNLPFTDETWCLDELVKMKSVSSVAVLLSWLKNDPTDTRSIGALYRCKTMESLQALFWTYSTMVHPNRGTMLKQVFWSFDEGKHRGWKSVPQIYEEAISLYPKEMIEKLENEINESKSKESMEAYAVIVAQRMRNK